MRPDMQRVCELVTQTVAMLCRNGLQYDQTLKVEGLLGITLDNQDVFLINVNEHFGQTVRDVGNLSNALDDLGVQLPSQMMYGQSKRGGKIRKQHKQPMPSAKKMKQRGQAGLRDVLHYDSIKNMTEEEEEHYWDSLGELGYDGEHEMTAIYRDQHLQHAQHPQHPQHPHNHPQFMNDMSQFQDEVIDLIDDEEEEEQTKSGKRKVSHKVQRPPTAAAKTQQRKRQLQISNTPEKRRRTENGDQVLEELDERDKKTLNESLESLIGKYLPDGKVSVGKSAERKEKNDNNTGSTNNSATENDDGTKISKPDEESKDSTISKGDDVTSSTEVDSVHEGNQTNKEAEEDNENAEEVNKDEDQLLEDDGEELKDDEVEKKNLDGGLEEVEEAEGELYEEEDGTYEEGEEGFEEGQAVHGYTEQEEGFEGEDFPADGEIEDEGLLNYDEGETEGGEVLPEEDTGDHLEEEEDILGDPI